MNPYEKELSASLAYNRFMERRVVQLEENIRGLLQEREASSGAAGTGKGWGSGSNTGSINSGGPTQPRTQHHPASSSAAATVNVYDQSVLLGSPNSSASAAAASRAAAAAEVMGTGGAQVVEELLRLRSDNELLKEHYLKKSKAVQELELQVAATANREAGLAADVERLEKELEDMRGLLPSRLFAERPGDSRKVKEILARIAKLREGGEDESSGAIKGSATAAAKLMQREADRQRSHHRSALAFVKNAAALVNPSDPNWRLRHAVHFMGEEGPGRGADILDAARKSVANFMVSVRAVDDTIACFNATARHAVVVIAESQNALSIDACKLVQHKATEYVTALDGIRASRAEAIAALKDSAGPIALLLRQATNALVGTSVRRVTTGAAAAIAKTEDLADDVASIDFSWRTHNAAIPAAATEEVLRLLTGCDVATEGFDRIEVAEIKQMAGETVKGYDVTSDLVSVAERIAAHIMTVERLVTGRRDPAEGGDTGDGAGASGAGGGQNSNNTKAIQCNRINERYDDQDAAQQYQRMVLSFLEAKNIEREATEEIRSKVAASHLAMPAPSWASAPRTPRHRVGSTTAAAAHRSSSPSSGGISQQLREHIGSVADRRFADSRRDSSSTDRDAGPGSPAGRRAGSPADSSPLRSALRSQNKDSSPPPSRRSPSGSVTVRGAGSPRGPGAQANLAKQRDDDADDDDMASVLEAIRTGGGSSSSSASHEPHRKASAAAIRRGY